MTDEWTPTTENVRFAFSGCVEVSEAQIRMKRHGAAFDRWLAAHDREVAEKAWDEGHNAGWNEGVENAQGYFSQHDNPYREGSDG